MNTFVFKFENSQLGWFSQLCIQHNIESTDLECYPTFTHSKDCLVALTLTPEKHTNLKIEAYDDIIFLCNKQGERLGFCWRKEDINELENARKTYKSTDVLAPPDLPDELALDLIQQNTL